MLGGDYEHLVGAAQRCPLRRGVPRVQRRPILGEDGCQDLAGAALAEALVEERNPTDAPDEIPPATALPFVAVFALLAGLIALTIFAGPVTDYTTATAEQLFDRTDYIDAVLKRP